ncbi:hypothetical protein BU17DRAFT_90964 [Hysterangium stoloniferum]|nr:hypothetical protein BU17DRAFT_90964 [Hysterangium stoloniferum]
MSQVDDSPLEDSVDETPIRPLKNQRLQRPHARPQSHHPHPPPLQARLEPPATSKQLNSLSARLSMPEPSHPLVSRLSAPETLTATTSLKRKTPPSPPPLVRRVSPPQHSPVALVPFQTLENNTPNIKPLLTPQEGLVQPHPPVPSSSTVLETPQRPSSPMELETSVSLKLNPGSADNTTVNNVRDSPSSSPISVISQPAPPPSIDDEIPREATASNLNTSATSAQSSSEMQPTSSVSDTIWLPHSQSRFPTHFSLSAQTPFRGFSTDNSFSSPVPVNSLDYSSLAFHMSPIWAECAAQANEWNEVAERKERGELLVDMDSPSIRRKRPRDEEELVVVQPVLYEHAEKRVKTTEHDEQQSATSAPAPTVQASTAGSEPAISTILTAESVSLGITSAAESTIKVALTRVVEKPVEGATEEVDGEEDEEEEQRAMAERTRLRAEKAAEERRRNLEQELAIKQREEKKAKAEKLAKERAEAEKLLRDRAEAERQLKLQEKLLNELSEARKKHVKPGIPAIKSSSAGPPRVVPLVNTPLSSQPHPFFLPPKPTGLSGGVSLGTVATVSKKTNVPAKPKPLNKDPRPPRAATVNQAPAFTTSPSQSLNNPVSVPPPIASAVVPKVGTLLPTNQFTSTALAVKGRMLPSATHTTTMPQPSQQQQQPSNVASPTPIPRPKCAAPLMIPHTPPSVLDSFHNAGTASKREAPAPFPSVNLPSKPASKVVDACKREASEQAVDMPLSPVPPHSVGPAAQNTHPEPVAKVSDSPAPPVHPVVISTAVPPRTKMELERDPNLDSLALQSTYEQNIPVKRLRSPSPTMATTQPIKKRRESSVGVDFSDMELTYPDVVSDSGWGEFDPELDEVDRPPGRPRRQRTPTPEIALSSNVSITRSPPVDNSARTPPRPPYGPREFARSRSRSRSPRWRPTSPVHYNQRAPYPPRGRDIAGPRRPIYSNYYDLGPSRGRSPLRRGRSQSPIRGVDHWSPSPSPALYPPRPHYEATHWRADTYYRVQPPMRSPSPPPPPRSRMFSPRGRSPPRTQDYTGSPTRAPPPVRSNQNTGYGRMDPPRLPDYPLPSHAIPPPIPSRASSSVYDTPTPPSPPFSNGRSIMSRVAPPSPKDASSRSYTRPRPSDINTPHSPPRTYSSAMGSVELAAPRLADRLSREHPSGFVANADVPHARGRGRGRGVGAVRGQQGRAKLVARLSDAPSGNLIGRIEEQSR